MTFLDWMFLGVSIGSVAYLAQIILSFADSYRVSRDRIEQSLIDLERIETQLEKSEHARNEAIDLGLPVTPVSLELSRLPVHRLRIWSRVSVGHQPE